MIDDALKNRERPAIPGVRVKVTWILLAGETAKKMDMVACRKFSLAGSAEIIST